MSACSFLSDPAERQRLDRALAAIDAANARDPVSEPDDDGQSRPRALLYGRRMSEQLTRFEPEASIALRIAAHAQHIERWTIPRADYPMDRQGYHRWRRTLAVFHAKRAGEILAPLGYPPALIERVQSLLRKENLKTDPETRTLEDVICLVFLRYYLADFSRPHEESKLIGILRKTWDKMSPRGRETALALPLAPEARRLVGKALAEAS